ncbi:fungal-specific transcription factor domain-containing protein [Exophiala viscosa]|uniref:Fungal-specific transcription factor domain-containing protein n=1 Tax=Exophiala viscosa TaxID=2486360 RepID=A0AAN6DTY1_9EURO|nr:fungal-specific transcription factor domain-containing protein [Exophiala viscosa]KAI1625821.1 fungal-specific transcription factor domain-containing protein [Exophiala viscosa]
MSSMSPATRAGDRRRLHYPRSRNGCLTCKRRKVRCDEQMPKCYHCRRLGLECEWKYHDPNTALLSEESGIGLFVETNDEPPQGGTRSGSAAIFDFSRPVTDPVEDLSLFQDNWFTDFNNLSPSGFSTQELGLVGIVLPSTQPPLQPRSAAGALEASLASQLSPILEPVENGPRSDSVQALLDRMADCSPMVRYAMTAFTAIQSDSASQKAKDYRQCYDKAANELSDRLHASTGPLTVDNDELRHVLATIFFLTYVDFLTDRLDLAHLHLANAHNVLQALEESAVGPIEQRIISWIRLLDARAAVAGGEGNLVNDTSPIASSSARSTSASEPHMSRDFAANTGPRETIYNMLCQPGIEFFQEVQTITGRIARIGHDRRSRGSVEDETEVMAIAANILKDLSSLYGRRPAILDHALSEAIGVDILAEPLTLAIRRSFQTYVANFYTCYIHLHRVAHRHLPRSNLVMTAIGRVKDIMHSMVNDGESIPVNMLWPLFMWGSEEDDEEESQWILKTMRSYRHAATNAGMAAELLQAVRTRQREAGLRVDISCVCLELFKCRFAII